jgi:hypothetical protein
MDDEVEKWINEMERVKKGSFDLSKDEDMSIALMNLISLEEHFFFTAMKTGNRSYLNMLREVRSTRKELLGRIVTEPVGEEWCISKHLLAGSMRLMEVGTKQLETDKDDAEFLFRKAFDMWSLFFAINLRLTGGSAKIADDTTKSGMKTDNSGIEDTDNDALIGRPDSRGMMARFSDMMKKMVDCCKE